ncbi:MAG TPA: PilZ domain-containing protein [Blastocatellia bacterium]|nr:PilZ domain-containing protein [Blastocatellia bacterium]
MSYPDHDRRRAVRHKWLLDLYFDGSEGVGIAQTRDVSLCGLYLSTRTVIPKGARLKLRLPINPEAGQYLVFDAEVAYSQPGVGVAVEFIGVDAESSRRLEEFLTENRKAFAAAGGLISEDEE